MTSTNIQSQASAEQIFWQAAEQGKLMLPRCKDTGKCFFYPRDHSPFTGGSVDWVESVGVGVIYSFCVSGREEPYCLAYIQLDDGPIMLSNVIADDHGSIDIGQRVQVCFLPNAQARKVPFFKRVAL